ncbi:MAG: hypothetical protein Q8W51_00350 [Candidatus Palauibacterales bacterium]|nr:hypothetical protein [Candidatus Palauibacterales bacterium]
MDEEPAASGGIRAVTTLLLAALLAFPSAGLAQSTTSPDTLNNIAFRNIGPSVAGGRVSSVVGVPGKPGVYYVGSAGGGVWKTTDGGDSWTAVFADQPTSSIGAVALAPSNPSLVWVGTGEANIRNDITNGHGVYFSPDGGNTWESKGLQDVGQIERIVVSPQDPDVVYVAAVGHAWTPNPDRGVFKTTDGGATWNKVLFVNDTTGAIDLVMQPGNPRVLLAAMWQMQRLPWTLNDGGAGSGIYRSTDGGDHWTKLTEGLPRPPIGRIALGIAPTNPDHVYALVEAKKGMLWASEDLGDHWRMVSDNHALDVRPFYFSQVNVAPDDEDRVYFSGFQLMMSRDGGRTAHVIDQSVHVDHHALWIDPTDPDRMIQGNDGGAFLTRNGGKSWTFLNNLPIEQFYMVSADGNDPYTMCGGLQDNSAWCGPSTGGSGSDWYTVTGGDGEYSVAAPSDSNIIYTDSQNGSISRLDKATGMRKSIRPYVPGVSDMPPSKLKYRFNWTSPIAVSPHDANTVYIGANVLFRSADGGDHWETISPDLTRNEKDKQIVPGGAVQYDISGAETYNTIISITLAPTAPDSVIWVGTDDGLVQVTRDGGRTWTEVGHNMPGRPAIKGGRIYQVGVSPHDAGTAYVAVDYHMYDNNQPYVYRTSDYGKSWTAISKGLPSVGAAHVVRESPNRKGFLVLGTDNAIYYSRDDGATWSRFHSNFPTAPVWDVRFVKRDNDLLVATHGRGLFVLNDLTPIQDYEAAASDQLQLFPIAPAAFQAGRSLRHPDASRFDVSGPPRGAVIDYYLPASAKKADGGEQGGRQGGAAGGRPGGGPRGAAASGGAGQVQIAVLDAAGDTIATDKGPGHEGFNRFEWNLHYAGPTSLELGGGGGFGGRRFNSGPPVVPGTYTVAVTANGTTKKQSVKVEPDPRHPANMADFRAQTQAGLELTHRLSALNEMLNRIQSLQDQIASAKKALKGADRSKDAAVKPVLAKADSLDHELGVLKDSLYNSQVQEHAAEDDIHYLSRFRDRFNGLRFAVAFAYASPPSPVVAARMQELGAELNDYLDRFNGLLSSDVSTYNQAAASAGVPTLVAGEPIHVKAAKLP